MNPQITHICLHIDNLEKCVQFYQKYCQLEIIDDRSNAGEGSVYMSKTGQPGELVFQLMSGGKDLSLEKEDEQHFGFQVNSREDVDTLASLARQEQILVWEADEYLPGAYLCTIRDPNGNHVEFSYGHSMPPL